MATAVDLTAFNYALKEIYTPDRLEEMYYKTNPLLALIPKATDFFGEQWIVPISFNNPQGRSKTFSKAQSNRTSGKGIAFAIKRVRDYGIVNLDNETMEASMNDIGAFVRSQKRSIDGIIQQVTRSLAIGLYRKKSATIGKISATSSVASATITLAETSDITNFEVDQVLNLSAADGGGSVRVGSVTVLSLDRDAGTITVTGASWAAGIAAAAVGDFIVVEGDYDAGISGLSDVIPATAPTLGDSFHGVDRSPDPTRLAGVRVSGTSEPIEEAFVTFISKGHREGAMWSHIFCNHAQWSKLSKALGAKVQYAEVKPNDKVAWGWTAIVLNGATGPINVIPDVNCPNTIAFGLQMDTFLWKSLGPAPKIYDADGLTMLRASAADEAEVRVRFYGNVGCFAPGYNGRLTLPTA